MQSFGLQLAERARRANFSKAVGFQCVWSVARRGVFVQSSPVVLPRLLPPSWLHLEFTVRRPSTPPSLRRQPASDSWSGPTSPADPCQEDKGGGRGEAEAVASWCSGGTRAAEAVVLSHLHARRRRREQTESKCQPAHHSRVVLAWEVGSSISSRCTVPPPSLSVSLLPSPFLSLSPPRCRRRPPPPSRSRRTSGSSFGADRSAAPRQRMEIRRQSTGRAGDEKRVESRCRVSLVFCPLSFVLFSQHRDDGSQGSRGSRPQPSRRC
jgi:hypothetical protein